MSQRQVVTKTNATRYRRADTAAKGVILDELCAMTGWHLNHARKALAAALTPKVVRPRAPRAPRYDANTIVALRFCCAVLGAPTGERLAPMMGDLVPRLRRFEELSVTEETATALVAMSAATMDRRLAADRAVQSGFDRHQGVRIHRASTGPDARHQDCPPSVFLAQHAEHGRRVGLVNDDRDPERHELDAEGSEEERLARCG